ncbi:MAG: response regulator [Candidatus Riflebacteria bacterium]|nr:response regulator [Candidatus Riflebacteria bacterium]
MKKNLVLIVDDEKNIRLTMTQSLESINFSVQTAVNGEEALQKLCESSFDLVCLDLKMPGMDGMDVLRQIRKNWPQTSVIIVTAYGTVDFAVEAMKLGAVDFIQKPFSPGEIRELATSVLERKNLEAVNASDSQSLIKLTKRQISDCDFDGAGETAKKALAANPADPEAYNLLGAIFEIKGNWLEAQKFYRNALEQDPSYKPARVNLERTTSLDKSGKINLGIDDKHTGKKNIIEDKDEE